MQKGLAIKNIINEIKYEKKVRNKIKPNKLSKSEFRHRILARKIPNDFRNYIKYKFEKII
ncbi:hypothetical protein [Pectinatus sottacetonis]|uniref:hypothetical protein n=1 Tax=Pectinatus sottacetonis TaxID=1002795 RepID=UPI0018C80EB8|nr:hypothetical protein [Pectinatus sottacetonis]